MVGTKASNKLRRARSKKAQAGPSAQDFECPDLEDSIDWEALANEDSDGVEMNVPKNKEPVKSGLTVKQYVRRKSSRSSGVHINEPVVRIPTESPWIEGRSLQSGLKLPTSPSEEATPEEDTTMLSICREQRRLSFVQEQLSAEQDRMSVEQERMSGDLQLITSEQQRMKKKCSKISSLIQRILNKMGCSSSEDTD